MATTSSAFPLATEDPYTGPGSASSDDGTGIDNAGGASGSSPGAVNLSRGAIVAIIVIVVAVALMGITSAVLFYLAKTREWKVRESIRRSAKRVVTALTPRRSEFPRSLKDNSSIKSGRSGKSRTRVRLDDVPPTPRLPEDVEKGLGKPEKKRSNFSRK